MKRFVVREGSASERDVALIAPMFDLYRQFYGKPADPKLAQTFIRDRLKARESVIFIAIPEGDSGEGLGFVQLYPSFSSVSAFRLWVLNDLFVSPDARASGAGRALLERAERWAAETGAKGLTLSTQITNLTAQRLYEACGWTKDDEFVHYHRFF